MMNRISCLIILLSVFMAESGSNETNKTHNLSITDDITSNPVLPRDKRGSKFQLDQSEIARQNQITQQIFAKYVERRLFPNSSTSQKIPTIDEILPKQTTTTTKRPTRHGYLRRRNTNRAGSKRYSNHRRKNNRGDPEQEIDEQQEEHQNTEEIEDDFSVDMRPKLLDDDDSDGQESLQSVESEQHDQYYEKIFNRDPSENEVDSGEYMEKKFYGPFEKC